MGPASTPLIRFILCTGLLGSGLVGMPASAFLIELSVTGEVTFVSPITPLPSQFSLGQSMAATFVYDSDTLPVPSLILTRSTYLGALKGGSFIIGTYAGTTAGGTINKADDDPTFNDRIRFGNDGVTAANLGTHIPFEFEIEIEDASQNAFSDLALPLTLPDLALFTERSWALFFTPIALMGFDQTRVEGRLLTATLTTVDVPEPSSVALLAFGVALLPLMSILYRRRTRQLVSPQIR